MGTFEINQEEVNVEEIMKKIRENIRKKGIDAYPIEIDKIQNNSVVSDFSDECSIKRDLEYINSNWDIQNNDYLISSHRPVVGKFLIKGREVVHGEVRRYVDPMVQKQTVFNEGIVSILNNISSNSISLNNKVEKLKPNIDKKIEQFEQDIDNKIEQLKLDIDNRIKKQVDFFISSINSDLERKSWLANLLDNKINGELNNLAAEAFETKNLEDSKDTNIELNYFAFEDRFRGSRDEIKQRQLKYLNYFKDCRNVLDIGCGRGEFLELLRENGIKAQGLDIDLNMVNFCKSKELKVNMMDAIAFLKQVEDNSLDGIFIDQVVEHLEPDYLIKMLNLCYRKLMYGYFIIIETVNPLSFVSLANFYIDLSHVKPLHPETMRFLLEVAGFREIELNFYSPVPDEIRLQKVQLSNEMGEQEKLLIETFNHNIDVLNNQLYGPQDYAFFGKK
ncbi:class I SAM-dependent methyltransferase [Methanosarcina sp.]|uniref:class I SAM-dependent methyltransferase n=1 Tax=Methanosarcina sp. TaxID=2213 RepID=UPI002AB9F955|nr:class I SAM-dependent methyltransferase [Methanosarcina sp.]MDY9927189.1 class I SAM-dependent methyltransferase [Methanosarcina sp.]